METFFLFVTIAVGLLVGSFLNVCIFRVPRGESVVTPSSHCPKCFATLTPLDLVPVLTWVLAGRRCRYCGFKVSSRYPFIEMLTGSLFGLSYLVFGPGLELVIACAICAVLVVVTMIDIDFQIIPNTITFTWIIIALLLHLFLSWLFPGLSLTRLGIVADPVTSFAGIAAGGGLLWLIAVLSRGGMGMGDVKLAAALGASFGPKIVLITLFISFFLGAGVGMLLILVGLKRRKDYIPFGPYIALAAVIVILVGPDAIAQFYWKVVPGALP
ncbi:MAG: prepilin peptidase [Candidatus Wallbacteria bacterium HGW-Wallbacteria-1]|jgi:leader peptidase (prepilin peptidase)/N-methyltransferase|uniref:Prepilin leader peptidase/N-methyltransferase n=1 Tax=Candidatus Wallbacteria bacterium HGW-Wallbacteria-1 TaxID=2013854 RepID=A0A2N1PTW2_9BACT|nr:MAG: prepilin peptidase [Candidatus Wallbacteria bacterium HGW-Wallbacteria-1]